MQYSILFLTVVFIASLFVLLLRHKSRVFVCEGKNSQDPALVIWNSTDADLEVSLRFKKYTAQRLVIGRGTRGCIVLIHKEVPLVVKSLMVLYKGKRYRFIDRDMLNAPLDPGSAYFFAVTVVDASSGLWQAIQERCAHEHIVLDMHYRYLVLAKHAKLSPAWAPESKIAVLKMRMTAA